MTPLERQIKAGESKGLVFSRSAEDVARLIPHVVALLNSGGGTVVIGVGDDGKPLGIPDASKLGGQIEQEIRAAISPMALFSVAAERVGDEDVVVIEVPGGRDVPFVTEGKVYLRRGARTVAATGEDLQRIFQQRTPETERWERRASPTLGIEDLDHEQIETTVHTAVAEGRFQFRDHQSAEAVLSGLGMVHQGMFTNAADVCFGRTPAIRNPQVRLRAFAFQSDKRGDEYLDQADLSGPLANVLASAVAFIQRNSSIAAKFLPESIERKNIPSYPPFAVREGLVNALAHRDYSAFSSGATLLVYPDRLEIWNSGKLPDGWSADKLRHSHPSLPSNPDIAQFLYVRNLMERIGRGTTKMIEACREAGIPSPTWKVDSDGITLTLYNRNSPEAPVARLTPRQEDLLKAMKPGEEVRLREYAQKFASEVSDRQARRDLKELEMADLLRLEGKGPSAFYVRTQRPWNR
jgi:ATP-dependent DNA helicase RecG